MTRDSAAAYALGIGMLIVRKPGKLPRAVLSEDYALEYRTATLVVQPDDLPAGSRVLVLDDVLATGGTLSAAVRLVERSGWVVAGVSVVLELSELGGRGACGTRHPVDPHRVGQNSRNSRHRRAANSTRAEI